MALPAGMRPWLGVFIGILVAAVIFILQTNAVIPPTPSLYYLLNCSGSFAAGLLTKGDIKKGALVGILCGGAVFLWNSIFYGIHAPNNPIGIHLFAFFFMFGLILSLNITSGIIGITLRNGIGGRILHSDGYDAFGKTEWLRLLGIVTGAMIIVSYLLVSGYSAGSISGIQNQLSLLIVLALLGGIASGTLTQGGARSGVESALWTAAFDIGILASFVMASESFRLFADMWKCPLELWDGFTIFFVIFVGMVTFLPILIGGAIGGSARERLSRNNLTE